MARITLTKLVLFNFGPFVGRHVIDLPSSGLVIVQGKNLDSGGESGAGKTKILHGIAYAFGYAPYSAKALQSWLTEDPMSVEVHMDTSEGPAILTRGERLSLKIGDKEFKGSAKAVEAELDRLCGVSGDLRAALTYRGQKRPGLFLSMTDAEKKEFFVEVLKLHWAEKAIELAAKNINIWEKVEATQKADLDTANALLQMAKDQAPLLELHNVDAVKSDCDALSALVKATEGDWMVAEEARKSEELIERQDAEAAKEAAAPRVRELEAQIAAVRQDYLVSKSVDMVEYDRCCAALAECRTRLQTVMADDAKRKDEQLAKTDTAQLRLDGLIRQHASLPAIERDLGKIDGQLAKLRASACPTCGREWVETQDEIARLEALRAEADAAREHLLEVPALMTAQRQLVAELRAFMPDPRVEKYQALYTQLSERVTAEKWKMQQAGAVERAECEAKVAQFYAESSKLRLEAEAQANAVLNSPSRRSLAWAQEANSLHRQLLQQRSDLNAKLAELTRLIYVNEDTKKRSAAYAELLMKHGADVLNKQHALDETQRQLRAEQDFHALVKGFLNAIFDEILAEITDETNATLGTLPNVAHITIRFVSDYQTQKGTTKQAIVPITSFNGVEQPLQSGCSGGQETSLELAVDLAVGHVVSRRTGSDLGWLILDESFTGHDQVTKESCLEVLQKYAGERLVLIVDHGSEAKEMFTQRIQVVHEHAKSKVS